MPQNTLNLLSIGGNALSDSKSLKSVLEAIYLLSRKGGLLIVHGNGPQVGKLASLERIPLALLTAQTEAEMGVELEEEISKFFMLKGKRARIETVLTKVLVSKSDKGFKHPSKPIGKFYTTAQAKALSGTFTIKKLIGGYRRVVSSPLPLKVINLPAIKSLLSKRYIVIAAGGGGIAMTYGNKKYDFCEAVIDKDYTGALLARSLHAKMMITLTNVDGAYLDFGKNNARLIGKISARELASYAKKDYFEQGSMGPKVNASVEFVRKTGGLAAIGNIKNAIDVMHLKGCTVITKIS